MNIVKINSQSALLFYWLFWNQQTNVEGHISAENSVIDFPVSDLARLEEK